MAAGARAGEIVAGFRVLSIIGAGAMGNVYLAERPHGGENVALKVLATELARNDRFRRRFLRETELAASLDHPNVVRTLASGEANGVLYLAMEHVDGSDLRELLRQEGRLEPERAVTLLGQVAAALDAAHEAGLVHRDVKPANILVTREPDGEHALVCDFGLARHVSSPSSLTGERGFVGTIDYVSPEQIEGGTIDGRADVYSLGCVLYECLAGTRPFDRDSELAVVFAHLNEQPLEVSAVSPELPRTLDAVFDQALDKAPDERFATCGQLIAATRDALQGRKIARPRPRRRLFAVAAGGLLVAAAAGAIAVLATRGGPSTVPEITQTSIAGAPLGLRREGYERRFGEHGLLLYQQRVSTGYATLTFEDKKIWVFFPNQITGKAGIVTTWNRGYRTAAGIGPCSTVAALKAAYGNAVKPDRFGTIGKSHFVYDVGKNLVFAAPGRAGHPSKYIAAVGLFNGSARAANAPGGARSYAGFVAANDTPQCHPS